MSITVDIRCDSCRVQMQPHAGMQWAACAANGWRNYDACSRKCANEIRQRFGFVGTPTTNERA